MRVGQQLSRTKADEVAMSAPSTEGGSGGAAVARREWVGGITPYRVRQHNPTSYGSYFPLFVSVPFGCFFMFFFLFPFLFVLATVSNPTDKEAKRPF